MLSPLTVRKLKPGSFEQFRSGGQEGYVEQLARIAPYVESVGADGLYDIVEDLSAAPNAA